MSYFHATNHGSLLSTEHSINGNTLYASAMYAALCPESKNAAYFLAAMRAMQVRPGLFSRYPDRVENTAVDDHIALAAIPEFARLILAYGRSHLGFFDVRNTRWYGGLWCAIKDWFTHPEFKFKKKAFRHCLYRAQGFWVHARLSAGEEIGPIASALWSLSVYLATRSHEQDAQIQTALMILVAGRNHGLLTEQMLKAYRYWWNTVREHTFEVVARYIGNPAHPLVEAWKPWSV